MNQGRADIGAIIVCAGALIWSGPVLGARTLVKLDFRGPRSEEAAKRVAGELARMGIGIAPAGAKRGSSKGAGARSGPALVRGTITQLRGFWALRLSVRSADGKSLGGRSFPLRGARLDPQTAKQAARTVAGLVHRKSRRRVKGRRAAKSPPSDTPAGPMAVAIELRGEDVIVPVKLLGPSGAHEVKLRLDDKAPFSTVTSATLRRLGVPWGRAKMRFKGTDGLVRRPIAVIDGIALGSAELRAGLTVGVCDACGDQGSEGRLGRSFSRHFVVTVDRKARRLLLQRRRLKDSETYDISPFLQLLSIQSAPRAGKLVTRFVLKNRSLRALRDVVVSIRVPGLESPPTTTIALMEPGGQSAPEVTSPLPPPGAGTPKLRLVRASWKQRPAGVAQDKGKKGPKIAPTASPIYIDRPGLNDQQPPPQKDDLGFIVREPN